MDEIRVEQMRTEDKRLRDKLAKLEPGTKEYGDVIEQIKIHHAMLIETEKTASELDEKCLKRVAETEQRDRELDIKEKEVELKHEIDKANGKWAKITFGVSLAVGAVGFIAAEVISKSDILSQGGKAGASHFARLIFRSK